MKLSPVERLTLLGQYRILAAIQPDYGWQSYVDILEGGFESEYDRIADQLYSELPREECRFVVHTLAAFDALQRPYVENDEEVPSVVIFPGFDGNNEASYLSYFRYLLKDHRFTYLKTMFDDGNSHMPMVSRYEGIVSRWREMGEPHLLSGENAKTVLGD